MDAKNRCGNKIKFGYITATEVAQKWGQRVYHCYRCGSYHLTRQLIRYDKRTKNAKNKSQHTSSEQ